MEQNVLPTIAMPDVVTHRYDPALGPGGNLCSLSDLEASRVLDRLRRESRPTLKSDYLVRRRVTEKWLTSAANRALGQTFEYPPRYFFLGDFSYLRDVSRPAALILPLASLPSDAITFTLGDSMSVADSARPQLYKLEEMIELFTSGEVVAGFGLSDKAGFQSRFIEVQLWRPVPVCFNQWVSRIAAEN
jgi:hypothetical protein